MQIVKPPPQLGLLGADKDILIYITRLAQTKKRKPAR